ncbi:hypothetical protein [Polymorphum gilvum]|uniref:hypothetical protein n=1 Tax=Polymorphum gilvum TaxID=991904 RepID=UPI001A7E2C5B|nr:hypothetical protein [Polymorphum gilvum]
MGDEQGGGIGDRQVADAHDLIVGGQHWRGQAAEQAGHGGEQAACRYPVEGLAAGQARGRRRLVVGGVEVKTVTVLAHRGSFP